MIYWICIGLGIHIGLSCARRHSFYGTPFYRVVLGFIGCLFLWPLGLYIVWIDAKEGAE